MRRWFGLAVFLSLSIPPVVSAGTVDDLLVDYRAAGAGEARAEVGGALWDQRFDPEGTGEQRACSSCHRRDLNLSGTHAKTGKVIEPMAPSVNPERLTDAAKVEKWFTRNCKWTFGRECTPQEKADFLAFMAGR